MARARDFSAAIAIDRYESLRAGLPTTCRTSCLSLADHLSVALEPAEDRGVEAVTAPPWGWLEWFTLSQVLWGVLLFVPGSQAYRAYIRAFPYVMSLVALGACARAQSTAWVPGSRWMVAVLGLLVVNLARPETWLYSGWRRWRFSWRSPRPSSGQPASS
jgi:hypothetical protein